MRLMVCRAFECLRYARDVVNPAPFVPSLVYLFMYMFCSFR